MSGIRSEAAWRRLPWRGNGWLLFCLTLTSVIAAVDSLLPHVVMTGVLVIGPLLASARLNMARTAFVAGYALVLSCVLTWVNQDVWLTLDGTIRVAVVLLTGGFSIYVARERTLREATLAEVAIVAQEAVLGPVPRRLGGARIATRYRCATREALIGGDLYSLANTAFGLRVLIGDVRGKGLDATRTAAAAIGYFRDSAYTEPDLLAVVDDLEAGLSTQLGAEDFVTAVLAEFRPGEVRLANCGHHPPALMGRDVTLIDTAAPTTPLGLAPAPTLQSVTVAPGERVLFYTDGLAEARDGTGTMFALLPELGALLGMPSLEETLDDLLKRMDTYTDSTVDDDVALVLCEPSAEPEQD